jgi:hypothetical protein
MFLVVWLILAVPALLLGLRREPREWMVPEHARIRIPAVFASSDDTYTCVGPTGPYTTWGPVDTSGARGYFSQGSDGTGLGLNHDGSIGFVCGDHDYQL